MSTLPWLAPLLLAWIAVPSAATDLFDPSTPDASWDDTSPVTQDLDGLPVWDRVERLVDPDSVLFRQEDFPPGWTWDDDSVVSPHVATAFGSSTPHSGVALLHFAPGWALADHPYPVLLIPGAGASATGVMPPLARSLAADGHAVFALTFAHPHGDVFQQAEQLANAIARVREVTGADQVDLLGHSKGGIAAGVYLSHRTGLAWDGGERASAYMGRGTPFRGDVRRCVLAGVPLGGVDTAFRWTSAHLATGYGGDPLTPSAWSTFYPYTTVNLLVSEDLRDVDLWPDSGDAFPGQAQLLVRWDELYPLPGEDLALGPYALQQDWWTTYHGGLGFYSYAPGIDDAIETTGGVLDTLGSAGIDPGVEIAVLAGTNPLIWIDGREVFVDVFGELLADFLGQTSAFYADFLADVLAPRFPGFELSDDELFGVSEGALMFGEISGQSDGVLFTQSALAYTGLTGRGAAVLDVHTVDLAHMDLLFAGEEMGQFLIDQGEVDPDGQRHLRALGQRYLAEDTFSWYAEMLAYEGDDDDTADDDDSASDDDTGDDDTGDDDANDDDTPAGDDPWSGSCECSQGGTGAWAAPWTLLALLAVRRRGAR